MELFESFKYDIVKNKQKIEVEAVEMPDNVRLEMFAKTKDKPSAEQMQIAYAYVKPYIKSVGGKNLEDDNLPYAMKSAIWLGYLKGSEALYFEAEEKK